MIKALFGFAVSIIVRVQRVETPSSQYSGGHFIINMHEVASSMSVCLDYRGEAYVRKEGNTCHLSVF